jgi:hypothetical protein
VSQKLAAAVSAPPNTAGASAGTLEAAKFEAGELSFHGWARVPDQDRPADCIVLGFEADGKWKPFCVVETGGNRPDAQPLGSAVKRSGFSGGIRSANFPRGETILKAWAIDLRNQRAFPIAGEASVQNR